MSELFVDTRRRNALFWSEHWHIDGEYAWMFSAQYNSLCKVNLSTQEIVYLGIIPGKALEDRQYTYITKIDDSVYIMPDKSDLLVIYHEAERYFSTISLDCIPGSGRLRCTDARCIGDRLWVYSSGRKGFICVNYETESYDCFIKIEGADILWDYEIAWKNKYAFITSRSESCIYVFDFESRGAQKYVYDEAGEPFRSIIIHRNEIWTLDKNGDIHIIDATTMRYIKKVAVNSNVHMEYPYLYSCEVLGSIWLIPYEDNKIVKVSTNTESTKEIEIPKEQCGSHAYFGMNYVRDNRYIGFSKVGDGYIYEIDTKTNKYKKCEYKYKDKINMMRDVEKNVSGIHSESEFFALKEFVLSI